MEESNKKINTNEYEEEQIQQILLNESEKQKLEMDRELKESQDKEYQFSLEKDLLKIMMILILFQLKK